ncbi:2-hydroxyacid dehydrogenase [Hydrotalea sp.]|nr:2-hydroxyacid dehydrogenase [Hydrotalea sp.]
MKITFFSTQPYDKEFFIKGNTPYGFEFTFFETHLGPHIVQAVEPTGAICVFVNDKVTAAVIAVLAQKGVKVIALRCAGFNNVDIEAAKAHQIHVCRVPAYSPEAVAEHALAMILTLNRKTHKAYNRVREQNFSLNGLLGFTLKGKTVGVIGTGHIGAAFCTIMAGMGCRVLAYDIQTNPTPAAMGITYLPLTQVLEQADIISLHCPLTPQTHHLINPTTLQNMKKGAMLINTSRGGLIDTHAVIEALKEHKLGYLGIDVYEQEEHIFFKDLSENIIADDTLQRLMAFPNVLVTAHQAFFTKEALEEITHITLNNVYELLHHKNFTNQTALLV